MITVEAEADFRRDVWCLLGMPFDAIDLVSASRKIHQFSSKREKLVISTPNLNFAVTALRDVEFRQTIISSELNLLDGMPLLWVSRLLGIGIREKVSGSDLFEYICRSGESRHKELNLFFFGGEANAARLACQNVNARSGDVRCLGYLNPGFGPLDSLSSDEIVNEINQSKADFLIVALGARKGQLWINQNRNRLNIPVICHLGAVINFTAARVQRAPRCMQKSGLEWLWRIYQEPGLWKRYLLDGLIFIKLVATRVIPYYLWRTREPKRRDDSGLNCEIEVGLEHTRIKLMGDCLHEQLEPAREIFFKALKESRRIELDLSGVDIIDSAFLGLCQLLFKHTVCAGGELKISGVTPTVKKIFYWNCAEYML